MKKSVSKRIKIKKSGKILRRATSLGHSRTNKNSVQMRRKKNKRGFEMTAKKIRTYF
jgi:ribosomal protein L35